MHATRSLLFCGLFLLSGKAAFAANDPAYTSIVLRLVAGDNFVSLPVRPDSLRLADVFDLKELPAGKTDADSAVLFTYGTAKTAEPQPVHYRLSDEGHWMGSAGGIADDFLLSADEGYNLRLPPATSNLTLAVTGRVSREPVVRMVTGRTGETFYHMMSWPFAQPGRVGAMGLKQGGFKGGLNVQQSDELRILDNAHGRGSMETPKARIWLNDKTGVLEFSVPRSGSAEDYVVLPGEALIVVRKHGPDMKWTIPLP